jgi:hypothetical protein
MLALNVGMYRYKLNKLTNKIQAALLYYYTFQRQAELVCTELYTTLNSIGDIVILKNKLITEIEIKISLNDLQNELKKGREVYDWDDKYNKVNHKIITKHSLMNNNIYTSPNKYYFCVPTYMLNETIEFSNKLNPKYGVIEFIDNKHISKCLKVRKKVYLLHSEDNSQKYTKKMLDRLSNDLVNKYIKLYY